MNDPKDTSETEKNKHKTDQDTNKIAKELLDILVCPITKAALIYDKENNELISKAAKIAYPIHNGIPVMLPSEARNLSDEELERNL